jgi:hypothetical protein
VEKERLNNLFDKYVMQTLSAEEVPELMAYIAETATDGELEEVLVQHWSTLCPMPVFNKGQSEKILKRIILMLGRAK